MALQNWLTLHAVMYSVKIAPILRLGESNCSFTHPINLKYPCPLRCGSRHHVCELLEQLRLTIVDQISNPHFFRATFWEENVMRKIEEIQQIASLQYAPFPPKRNTLSTTTRAPRHDHSRTQIHAMCSTCMREAPDGPLLSGSSSSREQGSELSLPRPQTLLPPPVHS
jgi:hypothetical protein